MKKNLINIFLICSILGVMIFFIDKKYEDTNIETKNYENISKADNSIAEKEDKQLVSKEESKKYPKEEVAKEFEGYLVSAKLEIPEISLKTYILENYSEDALNTSVTKLYGARPNEIGNFCVAGHNFKNDIMFYNLRKLEIGDRFFIVDNEIGKVEYEIYDLYKVLPEDVSCLSQETDGNREVTLITCTNDAKKRIIVKAQEVKE